MTSIPRLPGFAFLVLVFVASAVPATAQGQGAVPHRGVFTGVGSPNSTVSGHATLLGNFVGTGTVIGTTPTGLLGVFYWTAANGDAIFGTFELSFGAPVGPTVFNFTETAVITGGTGRFAHATGSAVAIGTIDVVTSVFHGSFDGLMSSPGSLR